jgi:hypothetical protein
MSLKKVETALEGYESQFISQKLDKLTKTYYSSNISDLKGSDLEQIAGKVDGFSKIDRPHTEDKYVWFWGLHYKFSDGQVAVLFPWGQDFKKTDRVQSDRAIGVYYHGRVKVEQIDALLEKLYDAYIRYQKEEKIRLAEQDKKRRQAA